MERESKIRLIRWLAIAIFIVEVYFFGWLFLVLSALVSLFAYHLGHSIFAHRHFCHGQYNFSPKVEYILNHIFLMLNLSSSVEYSAIHVMHHKHSQEEDDPHDWTRLGFWPAFFGYLNYKLDKRMAVRYMRKPFAKYFYKNYFKYALVYSVLCAPIMAFVDIWRSVSVIFTHWDRGYPVKGKWILWAVLWGDENHELHHKNGSLDRLSDRDILYWIARRLEWI